MKVSVCCPSYKRPNCDTLKYLPFCKVYVDGAEYEDYKAKNPKAEIIKCDPGIQGNVARVRNYILEKEFEKGAEVVCLVDDDMQYIGYWENHEKHKVETKDFLQFVYKYSQMAMDLGAKMWGVNVYADEKGYMIITPLNTTKVILGPGSCFLNGGGCRYDEALPLKEDYDMFIQQCNVNRKVLRINKFFYSCKQSINAGGCASVRNSEKELQQLEALKSKWGGRIVKYDKKANSQKRKVIDYNPIIRIPIKGV